jgi:hypothetical protein
MPAMAASDDAAYHRVVGRITRITGVLTGAGTIAAFALGGWSWAAGFALGSAASWLSFHWLKQVVGALGTERPPSNLAMKGVLRYLVIAILAALLMKYTAINLRAALVGLLVSSAAVLAEIVFQLVHARD